MRNTALYGSAILLGGALWLGLIYASVAITDRLEFGWVGGVVTLILLVVMLLKGAEYIDRRRGVDPHW